MSQDLRVALITSLNDRLAGPLRRSLDEVERNLQNIERKLTGVTQASTRADQALAGMRGPERAARDAAELSRHTQNAVGLAERLQRAWSVAGNLVRGVSSGMASVQAARYVVAEPLKKERSYTRALADASNVAFSDQDVGGRQAGRRQLDQIVTEALRKGGGSREDALAGLNDMISSGVVNVAQAGQALPSVTRYATAGNASVTELSGIVVRALQAGFKEADIPRLLDMALVAGQKGGFELKDMAKWLPKLMAAGKMSGLGGMEGYARILASAEASVTTAGSKEEAGNNLLNLLLKINSQDTANDAKKLGIDLSGSLAAARGKGVNSLDAFVNLVDQVSSRDPRLAKLRKEAGAAGTSDERRANAEAQADILQGSAIGKIVQDRQALLALVAELNKKGEIRDMQRAIMAADGTAGRLSFENIASTPDFKIQQSENEQQFAQTKALEGVNGHLGTLADRTIKLYQEFPGLAAAVEGAKLAIMGMAAAAAGAAGALALFGLAGRGGAGAAAAGGAAAAARGAAYSSLWNGPTGGAAVAAGGGGLAAAGAVALPAAVLGGGMLMSDRLNTVEGLSGRIASRNERLKELSDLAALDNKPGKYDREIEQLTADRDRLSQQYGSQVGGGRGVVNPVNVKVYLDGREMNAHVESEQQFQAKRR